MRAILTVVNRFIVRPGWHILAQRMVVKWENNFGFEGEEPGVPVGARPEIWGNWTIMTRTKGHFTDLKLGLHAFSSAHVLLECYGGQWTLQRTDLRVIGGFALDLLGESEVDMEECALGGIDRCAHPYRKTSCLLSLRVVHVNL